MSAGRARGALDLALGVEMHGWARDLFPIMRSLSGPGVRETLDYLDPIVGGIARHEAATGTQAFDWTVPDEWTFRAAYIEDAAGRRVVDVADHTLHVVGYSEPVDRELDLEELQAHLHSLPGRPDAIPYVTSYYTRRWGFCLTQRARDALAPGRYRAVIDADLKPGALTYGDVVIPGAEPREILLSTYVCHPSMANNELSGPVVAAALARWLRGAPRRFTYRLVFVPETIGAIVYLSRNLAHLKAHVAAGFVLTCLGDERAYSYLASRRGDTLADRAATHALSAIAPDHRRYSFLDRGSDERQYCSPGVDLPVCSVMRSKYGVYPEYHTSRDDLSLVTPAGLAGGYAAVKRCVEILEENWTYRATTLCEPQLGKRGLYPSLSSVGSGLAARRLTNVLAYADGARDLIDLAEAIGEDALTIAEDAKTLEAHGLLERLAAPTRA